MNPEEIQPQEKVSPLLISFSIIVAGALIGGGIYLSSKNPPVKASSSQLTGVEEISMIPISDSDHILGSPNASVIIVEYSDTECPFCKVFHQTMKRIVNEYGKDGKVAWIYRHFPIQSLHSKAPKEAEATECAAELGGNAKFWEYLDAIFTQTGSNDSLDPSALPKIAKSIGLDEKKFSECLSSGKYSAKIITSIQDAVLSGAKGTPNSILVKRDGQKAVIQGAQSYEVVKAVIDTALAK
jgi:protein-disulfide isomerase